MHIRAADIFLQKLSIGPTAIVRVDTRAGDGVVQLGEVVHEHALEDLLVDVAAAGGLAGAGAVAFGEDGAVGDEGRVAAFGGGGGDDGVGDGAGVFEVACAGGGVVEFWGLVSMV